MIIPARAVATGLVAIALAGCGAKPGGAPADERAAIPVGMTKASIVELHRSERLPGTVRADHAATVGARISGQVSSIDAVPGRLVSAGDTLVELRADELRARRDQAQAIAKQADADLTRAGQLIGQQVVTQAGLDAARSRADASASALAEAEAQLGYTRIVAPFSGVVVRRHVDPGAIVAPGTPLIDLEDPATLRLEVQVPESIAATIAMGAQARVTVDAASFVAERPVVEIVPAADPATRSMLVKLSLPASPVLHSGQFGRVAFDLPPAPALCVPVSAVIHRGQLDAVLVAEAGVAHLRLVRLGEVDAGHAVIRAGLADGETVITEPGSLSDGARVVPR